jgi:CRISPR/Cas system-associated exonuclease Cas4 (RecB family)
MFQVINAWNLVNPKKNLSNAVRNIKLRGYDKEVFLTGEFTNKLVNGSLRPLSVSNIADKYCPTRRDLYFYKGINRLAGVGQQENWGGKAGYIVEEYVECVFQRGSNSTSNKYTSLVEKGDNFHCRFIKDKSESIERLKCLEENSLSVKAGDTDWLLTLLSNNGRAELGIRILHSALREDDSLDTKHVKIKQETRPHIKEIGVNSPATSDFIIPEFGIVGDIKTGVEFKPHFQLTCAGYALSYENQNKKKKDNINWGIIYFFPTRNPSAYVRPITFTQIYVFPIDDYLRQWFLDVRDEAYNIVSKGTAPNFPESNRRKPCHHCRFKGQCISQGLELSGNEW